MIVLNVTAIKTEENVMMNIINCLVRSRMSSRDHMYNLPQDE